MIGYYIQNKDSFAEQARYVFRQLTRMIGLKMAEVFDLSDTPAAIDAMFIYGISIPERKSEWPFIFIAQSNHGLNAALTPHDIGTIAAKRADMPQHILYLLSSEIAQLPRPLYVDRRTAETKISWDQNSVICAVDVISTCFYFLSLENEQRATDRDFFRRFQRDYSPLGEEIYTYPVVDRYAVLLGKLLRLLLPRLSFNTLWPDNKTFAVALSHDVDRIQTWTMRKAKRALRSSNSPYKNPVSRGFRLAQSLLFPENWLGNFNFISRLEQRYGANSTFFFVSQHRHELDPTYKLNSPHIRQGIETLRKRGCDIGLHGTIPSATTNGLLELEKEDIEFFIDDDVFGGRQHYLCYTNDTLQFWQNAQLKYDSTLGFSYHTGYRCGTSFPFHLHDGARELPLIEIPPVLMDTVLFLESKQFLSAADAWIVIQHYLDETRHNNGLLTINWHSSDLHPFDVYGYSQLYVKILQWTQENNGWLVSLNQVYEWWRSK